MIMVVTLPSTYTVYLSGSIHSPVAFRWRADLADANNYEALEFTHLDLERTYQGAEIATETASLLQECDGVIAHYEPDSDQAQTACELLMAKRFELPIVVWTDQYTGTLSALSAWWHYVATKFCQTGRHSLESTYKLVE